MDAGYALKGWLKQIRWRLRRGAVALHYGRGQLTSMPVVLGNAMPKSGSHLIIQVLQGLTRLGPFVNPGFPPLNRTEDNAKLADDRVLAGIQAMRPGDIGYGYISASGPFISALTRPERATIFIYRDPRDMIVSHIFYATEIHQEHWMHRYYTETLNSMEERINAAILGVQEPGSELTPICQRYAGYLGWLEQPQVLCLRFEDLILDQEKTLALLLDYLAARGFTHQPERSLAVARLQQSIQPAKSGTFRRGRPGNWQEYFTPANKILFKEHTGNLLLHLGYEQDSAW
jgi:hypothetical protein